MTEKIPWNGRVLSVQPRIRLTRSFDQRSHSYLGYVLRIDGTCGEEERLFAVAIGKAAQSKHLFRADDTVSGLGVLVAEPRREVADLYKISRLKAERPSTVKLVQPPPFLGVLPELPPTANAATDDWPRARSQVSASHACGLVKWRSK